MGAIYCLFSDWFIPFYLSPLIRQVMYRFIIKSTGSPRKFSLAQMASTRMRANSDAFKTLGEGQEAHWEVVERMLFIYAKLNPGIQYVQVKSHIIILYHI